MSRLTRGNGVIRINKIKDGFKKILKKIMKNYTKNELSKLLGVSEFMIYFWASSKDTYFRNKTIYCFQNLENPELNEVKQYMLENYENLTSPEAMTRNDYSKKYYKENRSKILERIKEYRKR